MQISSMQKSLLAFAILCFTMLSCLQRQAPKVTVTGEFTGEIPNQVFVVNPLVNSVYWGFADTLEVDSLGRFQLEFDNHKPSFVKFLNPIYKTIAVDAGQQYAINIYKQNDSLSFTVTGKTSAFQQFWQSLPNPGHPQLAAMQYRAVMPYKVRLLLDSLLAHEVNGLTQFYNDKVISKDLLNLCVLDRTVYYNTIAGTVAAFKFMDEHVASGGAVSDSTLEFWESTVTAVPLSDSLLLKSAWAYYYIESYLTYKNRIASNFSWDTLKQARAEGTYHTYLLNQAQEHLTGAIHEFYNAAYLFSAAKQKRFESELIPLFERYKNQYPNSSYTKYIEPLVADIVLYKQSSLKRLSAEIFILDNDSINSFAALLKPFRGKKVFVDVWASWCSSCLDDFSGVQLRNEALRKHAVEMLYISVDDDKRADQWLAAIKHYNLNGVHVRANSNLHTDLRWLLSQNQGLVIPQYILVAQDGNVLFIADSPKHIITYLENN